MKQILKPFAALILFLATSFAANAEFRWGPSAGVVLTNLNFKQDLIQIDKAAGPTLGVQGEMMFPGIGFGIDIGALYSMQGATLHLGDKYIWSCDNYGTERLMIHSLSIPVDLRFKWTRMNGLEDIIAAYVFGGPVFDFTLGHSKMKAMEFAAGSIGVQAGLGFELFKRWQIQGSYVWGMTYALKATKLQDYSARERYWSIRATYFF